MEERYRKKVKPRVIVSCNWGQKSSLERNLIIALIVFIIFFIGLLLYIIIKPAVSKRCVSPTCLKAASQIMNRINSKIDPCEDFYAFACGNLHSSSKPPVVSIKEDIDKQIFDILNEPIEESEHYLLKMQKGLFRSCLNATAAEEDALEIVNQTINDLGWPVAIGYQWKEIAFDWQQMIFKLRRNGFYFQMMLEVDITKENSTYIVAINPPEMKSIREKYLYTKYMTNIAVAFGAEQERTIIEMERVLKFMESIQKIKTNANQKGIRTTIADYQKKNNDIDWLNFVNNILYPVTQFSSEHYVRFPSQDFTIDFFKLIYKTPKRIIANYIIWSMLENCIKFMPEEFHKFQKSYECQSGSAIDIERNHFCRKLSYEFVPAPSDFIFIRKNLSKAKYTKIKQIVNNVKKEFHNMLSKTPWLDETSRKLVLDKLNNVLNVIGGPGDFFQDSCFEMYSWPGNNEKVVDNKNFFRMLLNTVRVYQNNMFYRIGTKDERNNFSLYSLIQMVGGLYDSESNSMILPVGILRDIFYDDERPMYLNYGSIGSAIGHQLTYGFTEIGTYFPNNSTSLWTDDTTKRYNEKMHCMIADVQEFYINSSKEINDVDALEENLADYTGIRLAYSAYRSWVKEHGNEKPLVGVPFTQRQLFWIASITHQCFRLDSVAAADGIFRTIAPLRNTDDFAKDFSCPPKSPMNPPNKCQTDINFVAKTTALINFEEFSNMNKRICLKRTKIELILITALTILVLILIILTIVLVNSKVSEDALAPILTCSTQTCIKEALNILSRIDLESDPCQDFYTFACKNVEITSKHNEHGPFARVVQEFAENIEELYSEPVNKYDHQLVNLQRKMYQMCLNATAVEIEAFRTLQETLIYAGGWPVVEGYAWNEFNFDWVQATYKLRDLGYISSIYLELSITIDPKNEQRYIYKVSIPEVEDVYSKYFSIDENNGFMTDVAVMFGAEVHRALGDMTQTLEFLLDLQWIQNNNAHKHPEDYQRITIGEIQKRHGTINWINFINQISGVQPKLTVNDYVLFPAEASIDIWLGTLIKAPKRIHANYMMWRVVEDNLSFLTTKMLKENMKPKLLLASEPETRSQYCRTLLRNNFSPSPIDVVYLQKHLPEEKRKQLSDLIENLKTELKTIVQELPIDEETKVTFVSKIDNFKIVLGAPGDYYGDQVFDKMKFNVTVTNFIGTLSQVRNSNLNQLYGLINEAPNNTKLWWWKLFDGAPEFRLETDGIELPPSLLQSFAFNENRPNYINYGVTGLVMKNVWYKLVESSLDWIRQIKCDSHLDQIPDIFVNQIVALMLASKASYNAYKNIEQDEEASLHALEYTPKQLFWISAGEIFCYYPSLSWNFNDTIKESYISIIKNVINKNEQLMADFNCESDVEVTCTLY
ncbi:hypothetical protein FQA39_LY09388 [Lamprigera yunnana]|nr:hypothetical protein FQA39_LY09388 [Lamprigera yunnana]